MAENSKQMDAVQAHEPAPAAGGSASSSQATTHSAPAPSSSQSSETAVSPADAKDADAEGWVVQLGSFSDQKNADELMERLRKKAYQVFVEKLAQDGQTIYRVRIGPQRQRADAEQIRDKLSRELQLKAMVLHYP